MSGPSQTTEFWNLGASDPTMMTGPESFITPSTRSPRTARGTRERMPRDWYKEWSVLLDEIEESRVFPDFTSAGTRNADMFTLVGTAFAVESRELAIHRDLTNMDGNCAYVSTALDTITDAALGVERGGVMADDRPFIIESEDPNILKISEDMFKRIGLYDQELWQIARNILHFGTEFREIVYDPEYQSNFQRETYPEGDIVGCITRFDPRPWYEMWPNFDEKGNRLPGYIQKGRFQGIEQAINYEEWQIVEFSFGRIVRGKGTGLFTPVRREWRKLQYLEEGLILARVTRAYPKLLHKIPVPIEAAADQDAVKNMVESYKNDITTKRQLHRTTGTIDSTFNPTDVTSDFYVAKFFSLRAGTAPIETDVSVLEGSATHITDIADILHIRDKIITRSRVPRRYLGIEEKPGAQPSPATTDTEDVQFARVVKNLQKVLTTGIRKLINTELLFNGYAPHEIPEYRIIWAPVSTMDRLTEARVNLTNAQAALHWQQVFEGGLGVDFIVRHLMKLPQESVDQIVYEIHAGIEEKMNRERQFEAARAMYYNNPDAAESVGYDRPDLQPEGGEQFPGGEVMPTEETAPPLPMIASINPSFRSRFSSPPWRKGNGVLTQAR